MTQQSPPEIRTERTHQLFLKVTERSRKIFTDQTGRFPIISSRGYKYIMISYYYESYFIISHVSAPQNALLWTQLKEMPLHPGQDVQWSSSTITYQEQKQPSKDTSGSNINESNQLECNKRSPLWLNNHPQRSEQSERINFSSRSPSAPAKYSHTRQGVSYHLQSRIQEHHDSLWLWLKQHPCRANKIKNKLTHKGRLLKNEEIAM